MMIQVRHGAMAAALGALLLAACAPRTPAPVEEIPQAQPRFVVGDAYAMGGVWYYPAEDYNYDRTGLGIVQSDRKPGELTANGEAYDPALLTASHRTLPLPSLARVTNLDTGRSLVVRINDRGPADPGRLIGLTPKAAELLGAPGQGIAKLRVSILPHESRLVAAPLRSVAATSTTPGVADDGSPAPIAAPRPTVVVEGTASVSSPAQERGNVDLASILPGHVLMDGRFLPAPMAVQVPTGPARSIWIEAGEFTDYNAANVLRARLSGIAPARIDARTEGRAQQFHVRLGPFSTPQLADAALERTLKTGVSGAGIVID